MEAMQPKVQTLQDQNRVIRWTIRNLDGTLNLQKNLYDECSIILL